MSCPRCGKELPEGAKFCPQCGARIEATRVEEFQISADDLIRRVKELLHEGNIRRIVVRNEAGETLLEIPVTVGLLGALLAPYLAALGVIAAMVTRCRIAVERKI
jgi:repressor of nif and glnA expression